MARLITIDASRQEREATHAREAERMASAWRRSWLGVYAQCILLMVLGYVIYGVSFAVVGRTEVLVATSFVVAYALPFFRLLLFFTRNADQF